MCTLRSNDTSNACAGYWKIFPDIILNEFESLTTAYYKLDAPLIIDDLPTTTDEAKLTAWFSEKLYEAIQEDPASVKRVYMLSLSSERAFYSSFWRSSVVRNPKFYINLAITITSALTALFTYLRLSQPTSTSADALSRYAQENSANITAKAFALVSAAMVANNLTLPTAFLNMTLNHLTAEILNQSVVYLRQESQASTTASLLNIGALTMGIAAASLLHY